MNDELTNRLNMIGACLTLAESPESRAIWQGQPPAAFGQTLTQLRTDYDAVIAAIPAAESSTSGITEAKANAERTLEDRAYRLARGLAAYYRAAGDLANFGKVNVTRSAIVRLRHQDLATRATEIRDLAQAVVAAPAAPGQPVPAHFALTAARVTELTAAIDAFEPLRNAPRSFNTSRSGRREEVISDVADLIETVRTLDDLLLQIPDSAAVRNFAAAWRRAREIVDAGRGPKQEEAPAPPTPPTPQPGQ